MLRIQALALLTFSVITSISANHNLVSPLQFYNVIFETNSNSTQFL